MSSSPRSAARERLSLACRYWLWLSGHGHLKRAIACPIALLCAVRCCSARRACFIRMCSASAVLTAKMPEPWNNMRGLSDQAHSWSIGIIYITSRMRAYYDGWVTPQTTRFVGSDEGGSDVIVTRKSDETMHRTCIIYDCVASQDSAGTPTFVLSEVVTSVGHTRDTGPDPFAEHYNCVICNCVICSYVGYL